MNNSLVMAFAVSILPVTAFADDKNDLSYGAYIADQCASCHSGQGSVPRLEALDGNTIKTALEEYRNGKRNNHIMKTISNSLGKTEIAALVRFIEQGREVAE